jgi:hypothetical protein
VIRALAFAAVKDAVRWPLGVVADALTLVRVESRRRGRDFGPLRACCATFQHEWHTPRCTGRLRP